MPEEGDQSSRCALSRPDGEREDLKGGRMSLTNYVQYWQQSSMSDGNMRFFHQSLIFLLGCSWSQKLAEQFPARRPQLPGGSQLCVRAHRPLLRKDVTECEDDGRRRRAEKAGTAAAQHIFKYEGDPVSSVYCTRWWRRGGGDQRKLFFKRTPLIWIFKNKCEMSPTMHDPCPQRI